MLRCKKIFKIFYIVIVLLYIIPIIFAHAHPGKTDASGGHYDSATGEYHYHHGYSAHQHEDGVCPYDFDDKTDHSAGYSTNDDSNQNKSSNESSNETTVSEQSGFTIFNYITVALFALFLSVISPISWFSAGGISLIPREAIHATVSKVIDFYSIPFMVICFIFSSLISVWYIFATITEISIFPVLFYFIGIYAIVIIAFTLFFVLREYKQKLKYSALYEHKPPESLVNMPDDTFIGNDGLPSTKPYKHAKWGKYTVYMKNYYDDNTKAHIKYGCRGATIEKNIFEVKDVCQICGKNSEFAHGIPEWYTEYKNIRDIKEKYNIQ